MEGKHIAERREEQQEPQLFHGVSGTRGHCESSGGGADPVVESCSRGQIVNAAGSVFAAH